MYVNISKDYVSLEFIDWSSCTLEAKHFAVNDIARFQQGTTLWHIQI